MGSLDEERLRILKSDCVRMISNSPKTDTIGSEILFAPRAVEKAFYLRSRISMNRQCPLIGLSGHFCPAQLSWIHEKGDL